jgi:hypothetical protein
VAYCIVVRYHGPTDYRGGRWIATGPAPHLPAHDGNPQPCEHGGMRDPSRPIRATASYNYGTPDYGRREAAERVAAGLRHHGWTVTVAPGDGYSLPDDSGTVFPLAYD